MLNSDSIPETGRIILRKSIFKLTDTSYVYIDKERKVWVATEMCAQYTESIVD
jgi:hypothetical protein